MVTKSKDEAGKQDEQGLEARLRSVIANVEEARNHLMDARASDGDRETFDASLDALDDLLARAGAGAADGSMEGPPGVAMPEDFLHKAHHAIRGSLGSAIGHLDLLREHHGLGEQDRRDAVDMAWQAASDAGRYVRELFEIAYAWSQGPAVPLRAVSLPTQLREVLDITSAHATSRRVKIHLQLDRDVQRIRADPDGLQEMVEMVMEHAVDAAPEGTSVDIRARPHGGGMRIEVEHEGRCPWKPERHFTPFEPAAPGAPLGLAALPHLAQMRSGDVGVDVLEKGERLWIQIPMWEEQSGETRPAPADASPVRRSGPPRVLVVEDDKEEREALGNMLGQMGYEVVAAATVAQAVEAVESQDLDAITLDLLLGRGYSTRVLAAARTGRNRDATILVLSATRPGNVAFPYAVQGHLQKPVTKRTLSRALRWSGIPPPKSGPVLLVGAVPKHLERSLNEQGISTLRSKDPIDASPFLEEDPVVVVAAADVQLEHEFFEALGGAALILWGEEGYGEKELRQAAAATVTPEKGMDALLEQVQYWRKEQHKMTVRGGAF